MKYVRTKDGIYEYVDYDNECIIPMPIIKYKGRLTHCAECDIITQADTIEELIMPGDLVRYDGLYMSWIEKDRGDKVRGIDMHLIPRKSVDMLWIPTGNDTECYPNFKLVASKEEEKGKLELL